MSKIRSDTKYYYSNFSFKVKMLVVHCFILTSFLFEGIHTEKFCKSGNIHNNFLTKTIWKIHSYSQLIQFNEPTK